MRFLKTVGVAAIALCLAVAAAVAGPGPTILDGAGKQVLFGIQGGSSAESLTYNTVGTFVFDEANAKIIRTKPGGGSETIQFSRVSALNGEDVRFPQRLTETYRTALSADLTASIDQLQLGESGVKFETLDGQGRLRQLVIVYLNEDGRTAGLWFFSKNPYGQTTVPFPDAISLTAPPD